MTRLSFFLIPAFVLPFLILSPTLTPTAVGVFESKENDSELAAKATKILKDHCSKCHGNERKSGKLNLLDRASFLDSSRDIPAVVLKDAAASNIIKRVLDDEDPMPPEGKGPRLTKDQVEILSNWINAGAPAEDKTIAKTEEKPAVIGATTTNLSARVQGILRENCARCHTGASAEAKLQILDHSALEGKRNAILERIRSNDPAIAMPPATSPKQLTAEDKSLIEAWYASGAPAFEPYLAFKENQIGRTYVLEQIQNDIATLKKNARPDIPFMRYISFNHLFALGISKKELQQHVDSLKLTINHLSWRPVLAKNIVPIDPLESVYRIDIREPGWHQQPFEKSTLNLFDLVLLEYPYAYYSNDQRFTDIAQDYLMGGPSGEAIMARPIPFIHGDWFINAALQAPLYEDLLQLPLNVKQLENKLGVDSVANIQRRQVVRAGMPVSGVSRSNRVVERHLLMGNFAYYWKSYDYASSRGKQNMFRDPITLVEDGGEMIWSLPNGMQGYYIADKSGRRLSDAPTSIVTDSGATDRIVRNGISCVRCHVHGIKPFQDNIYASLKGLGTSQDFDIDHALQIYNPDRMQSLVESDRKKYLSRLEELLGKNVSPEILGSVTYHFADAEISGERAMAELGVANPSSAKRLFQNARLAKFGVAQLATNGLARRDAWEEAYSHSVKELNQGLPILTLNSLNSRDFKGELAPKIRVTTDAVNNLFRAGEKFKLKIFNDSPKSIFIDVIRTNDNLGEEVVVKGFEIKPGEAPAESEVDAEKEPGVYRITVLASFEKLPEPTTLTLPKNAVERFEHISSRVIHPIYTLDNRGNVVAGFDPDRTVRQSITVETLVPR